MRVLQNARTAGGRVAALGMFDGVHRGHRRLIRIAGMLATEMKVPLRVCTFNRHPMEIIRPENPPEMLSTTPEKATQMCLLGVDELELIPFSRATADLEPEAFLERLRQSMKVRAVVAGWNYSFGKGGRGNADMLADDGKKHGYQVRIVPPETLEDGTVISSSLVRRKLAEGLVAEARNLLGYDYTITGTVTPGKHQGSIIGYPTANIAPWKRKALPKFGVYTCLAETEGETLPAVANIGIQPTIPSGNITVEAHILVPCPSLYGRKIRLTPLTMLRQERHFDSVQALKEQIEKDRSNALRLFNME